MTYLVVLLVVVAGVFLVRRGKGSSAPTPVVRSSWTFGPVVRGENYTKGMPAGPTPLANGWTFNFPGPAGQVDAVVNHAPGPMTGARGLAMEYVVTGSGFVAADEVGVPGRVGLCLQRRGDDWSGKGVYQQYRLYGVNRPLLVAGKGSVVATQFTDVAGQPVSAAVLAAVLADLDNVAVVFGGSFASHGVYATQPSSFTLLELVPIA